MARRPLLIRPCRKTGAGFPAVLDRVYRAIAVQVTEIVRRHQQWEYTAQETGADLAQVMKDARDGAALLPPPSGTTLPIPHSREFGREILEAVVEICLRSAMAEGYFRLPNGFGSFRLQQLKNTVKRMPGGRLVALTDRRSRLRYEEGAAVRELIGMPPKTSYRRKYARESKLSSRATEIAFPETAISA